MKQQAEELSLMVYEVDGSRFREEMTELVERHFDPCFAEEEWFAVDTIGGRARISAKTYHKAAL